MTSSNRTPLRFKLAFFATALVVVVSTSLSTYIRRGQKEAIVEAQETNQLDMVRALRQVVREATIMDDDTAIVNYMKLLEKSLTTAYAMVLHEDGRVRVHTDPTLIGKVLEDPATKKVLDNRDREQPLIQNLKNTDGKEIIDISIPIIMGTNPVEYKGVARIGFDKTLIDKNISLSLRAVDNRIRKAFFLSLILGIGGSFLLATFITRPIETLRLGARKIGEGKLNQRIEVGTNDELQELADDFNLMAQKLGELDQMKQDFVSNVTHELRSPMTSIRGYIDLLLQEAGGPLSTTQRDYLSVVKNSAVRLARFIDNLLDVAKIEARKLKLAPEPFNLHIVAHEMEVLFKPQLDEKKIRFVNAVPSNVSDAFVDKDKVSEVLINFVSNAIKFTPESVEIKLTASEGSNHFEMGVHDTGVGIPADMIGKLFNKFEQVQSNQGHARKHKGTGLGLTIAKGIIEAHGGKVWITSPGPSGKGTTFYFTLPKLTDEIRAKLQAL